VTTDAGRETHDPAQPTRGDWIAYRLMVIVGIACGAVLGAAVFGFLAALVLAGLDATVGVTPPDLDRLPDTAAEWAIGAGALLFAVVGAVIGAREPDRPATT
jgi:hypothetical protein